ncbi:uncharacterized protein LOC110263920 [Arachis ipaensis]|uniref:uncharacterized protein LOC110263920 n=1 Tax=Arachis ipaensis TaxID=130454 RepID=UPI000A2B6AE9|nr:uncharacterized protein LOC110263920 [Arachis ipaensis]
MTEQMRDRERDAVEDREGACERELIAAAAVVSSLSPLLGIHRREPSLSAPPSELPPLCSGIHPEHGSSSEKLHVKIKVVGEPPEFLAAVGAAAGSARDCGCSILLLP